MMSDTLGYQISFCLLTVHLMTSHFSFKVDFLFLFFSCHLLECMLRARPLEKILAMTWMESKSRS